jgi:mono/diheme cytochrome c family protein
MKRSLKAVAVILSFIIVVFITVKCNNGANDKTEGEEKMEAKITTASGIDPFQSHRDSVPSSSQYNGPLFTLNHNYPDTASAIVNAPWQQALNGKPISSANALNYVNALKQYVEPTITKFLFDRNNWNAANTGWYQEPWTGTIREAILGTYVGSGFGPGTFNSLNKFMTTYVLTFYDQRAAYTLGQIWGKTAAQPNLQKDAAQFAEGSVIVKFAFTTANYPDWNVMQNALTYPVYDTGTAYTDPVYKIRNVSFFQFDIIVKDSKTAPKTGWVFSTLVYDKNAPGKTAWDKMVPLGAQWGNDPDVNSTKNPTQPLKENVINPKAPFYSKETLGWGGRLSGPNDGAVIPYAYDSSAKKTYTNLAASSCMSCHSSAQDQFISFLLPGPNPTSNSDTLAVFTPGDTQWLLWFRDNYGNVPFNAGQTGLDFDMVTAFKSIAAYQNTLSNVNAKMIEAVRRYRLKLNTKYNGR